MKLGMVRSCTMILLALLGCGNAKPVDGSIPCTATSAHYSCDRITVDNRSFNCIRYKNYNAGGLSCHPVEASP